jgi:hypothetical protein
MTLRGATENQMQHQVVVSYIFCTTICKLAGKVKVKRILAQALRLCTGRTVDRGCRGIALLYRH